MGLTNTIVNMKNTIIKLFLLAVVSVQAQAVMVVSEIETTSADNFSSVVSFWMSAVKTGLEIDDMQTYVFAEPQSKKMQFAQWFESKTAMVDRMELQDANQEKIWGAMQEMEPLADGAFEAFNSATNFRESSVWEYMPELSTTPETWETLSQEERDQFPYNRVQFIDVATNADTAYEQWTKDVNAIDKELGISYHYAVFKSIFGAKDADYMVICIDKSRFEYHNNWKTRMDLRNKNEKFSAMISENNNDKWSVIGETTWNRVLELTF